MPRKVLDESRVHPAVREKIANHHADIVAEVEEALKSHPVVVVGMKQNPNPKRARRALDKEGIAYHYLEYGSYFGPWRRRNALKMWSGWSTFPMVFVKGRLVGGANEIIDLIESGEIKTLLPTASSRQALDQSITTGSAAS